MRKYILPTILILLFASTAYSATLLFPYQGGTGTGTAPSSGKLLIGTSGGVYTPAGLTAGTNITITPGSGSITIAASGAGAVTSVDMSVPTGLTIGGNPITTSGTLALTLTSGYTIPLTASTTIWEAKQASIALASSTTGTDFTITDANPTWTLNLPSASAANRGLLDSADWTTFNNKGSGTVTSVAMTTPTGLTVTGSPITTSGTLALALTDGYGIPLTASSTQWATTYETVNASSTNWDTVTGKVPYTGATGDVNLGAYNLTAGSIESLGDVLVGSSSQLFLRQSAIPDVLLFTDIANQLSITDSNGYGARLDYSGIVAALAAHTFTFPNASGTLALGTGTINEIAYWAGTNTLGTLAVATYPSLTELSYVKGVTSAIQTQLGNKQPLDADLTAIAALGFVSTSFLKKTAADTWTLDTNTYLTGNQTITLSGDISGSGATAITTTIGADKVLESMLKSVNAATDEYCLTYELTTGDFEWQTCGGASLWTDGGTFTYLTATTDDLVVGTNATSTAAIWVDTAAGNLTASSTVTAVTFIGALTGNANTATLASSSTELAANPTDCGANTWATTIAANGDLTCAAVTYAGITAMTSANFAGLISDESGTDKVAFTTSPVFTTPNIGVATGSVSGNAGTATALAADPADCAANNFAYTIAASGALTCSTIDISASTNLTAGRSLTLTGDDVAVDVELYTATKNISILLPTTADTNKVRLQLPTATTLTRVACHTDEPTSLTIQLDTRDQSTPNTAGTSTMSASLVCADTTASTTAFASTAILAGDYLNLSISAASGTPAFVNIGVEMTIND